MQCRRLSVELSRSGTPVFVLTQRMPNLPSTEMIDGIRVYRIGAPLPGKLGSLLFVCAGLIWLLLRPRRFGLLHAHLASSPAVLGSLVSLLTGKPAIVKIAGSRLSGDIATSKASLHGRLKLAFLRATQNAFVCPSTEIRDELIAAGFRRKNIHVIANGVDAARYTPAAAEEKYNARGALGLSSGRVLVVYLGRLEPGKGIELLLSAWAAVEQRSLPENPQLLVIGKGSLENAARESASQLKTVRFLGWQEETERCLRASDIFVLPSLGEGMPNALIEAMACGLACIATDIGGVNELIIDGRNGILVPPGNREVLTGALTGLIGDAARRAALGSAARAYAAEHLSITGIAEQYQRQLYEPLLGMKKDKEGH